MEFLIGGTAAMGAGLFSNPLEVLKVRMQLQGELKARGKYAVYYKNIFHAGYVVAKHDGVLALQKGLVPALWVQLIMNGTRLGVYDYAKTHGYLTDSNGNLIFAQSIVITGIGAATGQLLASPFFLVKTHMQAQSAEAVAVGYQRHYNSSFRALVNIFKANGIKGIFRGATASIPRSFIGGSAQLLSFDYAKEVIEYYNLVENRFLKSFLGSMAGGVALTLAMTPFDLILTRLYNQPIDSQGKGVLYKSYFDCVVKIYKSEGALAFYKGIGPMYVRIGPHTVLCLVFWDELKKVCDDYFLVNSNRVDTEKFAS